MSFSSARPMVVTPFGSKKVDAKYPGPLMVICHILGPKRTPSRESQPCPFGRILGRPMALSPVYFFERRVTFQCVGSAKEKPTGRTSVLCGVNASQFLGTGSAQH